MATLQQDNLSFIRFAIPSTHISVKEVPSLVEDILSKMQEIKDGTPVVLEANGARIIPGINHYFRSVKEEVQDFMSRNLLTAGDSFIWELTKFLEENRLESRFERRILGLIFKLQANLFVKKIELSDENTADLIELLEASIRDKNMYPHFYPLDVQNGIKAINKMRDDLKKGYLLPFETEGLN